MVPKSQKVSDSDFGGSPTLFTATIGGAATPMVGACNKNGIYYAWQEDDLAGGPVWQDHVGVAYANTNSECDAAAIWTGSGLYIAGNGATIGGTTYPGELQQVNPATGAYIWRTGLRTARPMVRPPWTAPASSPPPSTSPVARPSRRYLPWPMPRPAPCSGPSPPARTSASPCLPRE